MKRTLYPNFRISFLNACKLLSIVPIVAFMLFCDLIQAQTAVTNTFVNGQNAVIVVPACIPSAISCVVSCWGGGGGAGGAHNSSSSSSGSGGGGGAYAGATVSLTAGSVWTIYSGAGGAGGTGATPSNGLAGGTSVFTNGTIAALGSITLTAPGGSPGLGSNGNVASPGGAGGTVGTVTGVTATAVFKGGNGAIGNTSGTNVGGSGGGSAGGGGAGGNAANGTSSTAGAAGAAGAATPAGGIGAKGPKNNNSAGVNATVVGGGGAGACGYTGSTNYTGGNGGFGQITLTYTMPAPVLTSVTPYPACGTAPSTSGNFTIIGNYFTDLTGASIVTALSINGTSILAKVTATTMTSITLSSLSGITPLNTTTNTISITTNGSATATTFSFTPSPTPAPVALSPASPSLCPGASTTLTSTGAVTASVTPTSLTVGSIVYNVYTYTSSGTFTAPTGGIMGDILVVGGGGGGGYNRGGGGGGGAVITYSNAVITAGSNTVTVGAGGAISDGSTYVGVNGGYSALGCVVANGGGGGAGREGPNFTGGDGICGAGGGGGGSGDVSIIIESTGGVTYGGGGAGGNSSGYGGTDNGCGNGSGGGGGSVNIATGTAGVAGSAGTTSSATVGAGGAGGTGISSSINGTATTYGGGGGGNATCTSAGVDGKGGNGDVGGGGTSATAGGATAGKANTGEGGSGASVGGSGIVIIRVPVGVWSSSNTSVATVTQAGVVTGLSSVTTSSTATISYTVTESTGCAIVASTVVTVAPCCSNPTGGSISGPATVCSGASGQVYSIGSVSGTVTTYTWTVPTGASITSGAGTSSITVNWGTATSGNVSCAPTDLTCVETAINYPVTVSAAPTANAGGATAAVCQGGTTVGLAGSIGGGATTGIWSDGLSGGTAGSFSGNSGSAPGTATYTASTTAPSSVTLTLTTGSNPGCTTTATKTLTINPKPVISNLSTNVCSGSSFSYTPTTGTIPSGTTYAWTLASLPSGLTNTAGSSGSGSAISDVLTNTTSNALSAVYTVIPTSGSGCVGASFTLTVVVDITPVMDASQSSSTCSTIPFNYTATGSAIPTSPDATTYAWSIPSMPAGLTGGVAATGQTNINGTLINSTSNGLVATYTVTPTSGACSGTPFTVAITVNPTPSLSNQLYAFCTGTSFSQALAGINPTGTTYAWSSPTGSGFSGSIGAQTGQTTLNDDLINTGTNGAVAVYSVTPSISGACVGVIFNVSVTIDQVPVLNASQTATACGSHSFSYAPTGSTIPGSPDPTRYAWSLPSVSSGLSSGTAASGQSTLNDNITNTTSVTQTATYTVTPTSGTCTGSPFTVVVSVNPTPVIDATQSTTACSTAPFSYSPTGSIIPSGTTYAWSTPGGSGFTGGAASSGSTLAGTLYNTTSVTQTAIYTVTPSTGSCVGAVVTVSVAISPAPIISSQSTTVCSSSTFSYTPSGTIPSGSTYSWNAPTLGAGLSGSIGIQSAQTSLTDNLVNSTNGTVTATYSVTATAGSCTGSIFTVTVTVNPIPIATVSGTTFACQGSTAPTVTFTNVTSLPVTVTYNVNGGSPATINIAASSTNSVTQSTASAAVYTYNLVSVAFQSAPACSNSLSGSAVVTVGTTPTISTSGAGTYCSSGGTMTCTVTGSGNTAYWQNTSCGTSTATPATSEPVTSTGTYYFNIQNTNGCWSGCSSQAFTVYPAVSASVMTSQVGASGTLPAFTTAGATSFTTTASGTITAYLWGGGGGGGGEYGASYPPNQALGGGGGGGACGVVSFSVSSGQLYSITVAAGGAGGPAGTTNTNPGNGSTGGTTTVSGPAGTWTAAGGAGGASAYYNCNCTHAGGAGSSTVTGTGIVGHSGGGGTIGDDVNVYPGCGGGGAGAGANGTGSTATDACIGTQAGGTGTYSGGVGQSNSNGCYVGDYPGTAGSQPGGGGGGGSAYGNATGEAGGAGGTGEVIIAYSYAATVTSTTYPATTLCPGGTPGPMGVTPTGGTGSGYTYAWYSYVTSAGAGTAAAIGGATSNIYSPGAISVSTSYYCAITNGPCGTINSNTINIVVVPLAVLSAQTDPTAVCSGTSISYAPTGTFTGGTTITYAWSAPTGTGITGSAASGQSNLNGIVSNSTTSVKTAVYSVTPTTTLSGTSCVGTAFNISVTVEPAATATISGTTSVCIGSAAPNVTFTNPNNIAETVTYTGPSGTQTINIGASSTATVSQSTAIPGAYTYTLTSAVFQSAPTCSNSLSGSVTVTVDAALGGTIMTTTTATGGPLTFTTSGSWTVPANTYSVAVQAYGGGGGGGGSNNTACAYDFGSGAGGGGYSSATFTNLTPLTSYPYVVGTGGNGAATSGGGNGSPGNSTSFNTSYVIAKGGSGGIGASSSGSTYQSSVGAGATIGSTSGNAASPAPVLYTGGAGGAACTGCNGGGRGTGGGGGGAGSGGNGNAATTVTGGAAQTGGGGAGANGVGTTNGNSATTASGYGGGGSGGGCGCFGNTGGGNGASGAIVINYNYYAPSATPYSNPPICSGSTPGMMGVSPSGGSGSGYTYQWYSYVTSAGAGSATAIGGATSNIYTPGALTATTSYYCLITNSCGSGNSNTITVIVATPVLSAQSTSTCSGVAFSYTPTSTATLLSVTTYAWAAPTGTGFTGGVSGAAGQTNVFGSLTNTTASAVTAIYSVTPTTLYSGVTCTGSAFTVSVTVSPSPVLSSQSASACGSAAFSYTPTGSIIPASTSYSWATPILGTGLSGSAGANSGSTLFDNLTNTTTGAVTATYSVTPSTPSCTGTPFTITVTVNPTPILSSQTTAVCSQHAFSYTPSGTILTGTYAWASPTLGSGLTGGASGTGQSTLNDNLTNTTTSAVTATYTVTPAGTPGGCVGTPFTVTVTVNPTPVLSSQSTSACSGTNFSYTPTGTVITGTYAWASPTLGTGLTGGASGIGQSLLSDNLTNTTTSAVTATYSLTPSTGSCTGTVFIVTVTVNPTPVLPSQSTTACSGTAFSYTPTGTVVTGTYAWASPTLGTGLTGGASGTGQSTLNDNLSNTTTSAVTATYSVTPTSGSCIGTSFIVTVTVSPSPTSASISDNIDPCNGGHTAYVTITGGASPYSFFLSCTGRTYTGVVPVELDANGASSCYISSVMDANGCPPLSITPSSVTYTPARTLTTGNTQNCTVLSGNTKVFYDVNANLMATITAGTMSLGNTTVITTIDGSVQQTPSAPSAGYPDYSIHPQSYLQRHFTITPTTQAPANVCLYISDDEALALNEASDSDDHSAPANYQVFDNVLLSNINITKYDGGSGSGTPETPGNHDPNPTVITSITATHNPIVDGNQYTNAWALCFNVGGFSSFYIHANNSSNDPLPVTLINFTATAIDNKYIETNWSTAIETNNSGFEVERSIDGINFADINWVKGHGNSLTSNTYQYNDMTALPGTVYYYRLKQVDVDGLFTYSNIASAMLKADNGFTLETIHPNPANEQVSVGVISNVNAQAVITMTDILGRVVLTEDWPMSIGYNINQFDISKFADGTYTVSISSGNIKTAKKLVITK